MLGANSVPSGFVWPLPSSINAAGSWKLIKVDFPWGKDKQDFRLVLVLVYYVQFALYNEIYSKFSSVQFVLPLRTLVQYR